VILIAPPLDADGLATVAAIDAINADLADRIVVPTIWRGVTYREIYVQTLEDGVARKERAPRVDGYQRAMNYVLQLMGDPNFKFDLGLISALHFMINEQDSLAWPGKWRTRDAGVRDGDGVVVYRAPKAELLAGLMNELVDLLNREDDSPPIVRAMLAMTTLIRIHPFRDGNGRLARCLYSLVMARAGYTTPELMSIEEYIGHHRREYDALFDELGRDWNPSANTLRMLRFCLAAQYRQALELLRGFQRFARLCVELNADMSEAGIESGASIAASDLFAAPNAEQLASWPRIVNIGIESAAGTRVPFRYYSESSLPELNSHTSTGAVAALLDRSLLEEDAGSIDPYELLRQWRSASLPGAS